MHKIHLRKLFHIKLLDEKEALGSSQSFVIGNVFYGTKLQVYYVKKLDCSVVLVSLMKLIR